MDCVSLISIPWDDVLFVKILPILSLRDLFVLRSMSTSYKTLVNIYLRDCKKINLAMYKTFNAKAFVVLINSCSNVRIVNFSRCTWLRDELLIDFLSNNHKIVDINMNYCETISPRGLQSLILNCRDLRSISLVGCKWLTSGALETLIYHQYKLETVDISKCVSLSEKSICKLIVRFPNLTNLSLAHIPSLTDFTVIMITEHCQQLRNLNIDGCRLTTDGIKKMLWRLSNIETIKISGNLLLKENKKRV